MKKSNLKFYPLKIYCIAIFLNLIPNFALIAQDWSSNDRKLMGGVYLVFLLVIYVPFLFISKEKSISKILFFLPSIITVVLLSVFFVVKTELETLLFCLVIIIPNLLLQGLIFLYHYKKIKHQYIKLFKLISLTVFILLIGMVIPFSIASNISNDKTTQYVFRAGFVLVLFAIYCFYNRNNNSLTFQSPIIPIYILWVLPFLPILIVFISSFHTLEFNSVMNVLLICLSIGIMEEIVFRGVLFRLFQKTVFPVYLLVSATLFGLFHLDTGVSGVLSATLGGLLYGLARISGFPLLLLIICHAVFDIPSISFKYGNTYNTFLKDSSFFQISFSILFVTTLLITILYLSIPKHWTNKLDKKRSQTK